MTCFKDMPLSNAMEITKRKSINPEDIFMHRRSHVRYFGEHSSAILLQRLIYWSGRSSLDDYWIYKTAEDLAKEVEVSARTIMKCKEKLEACGIIETKVKKVGKTPTLHWRVNPYRLDEIEAEMENIISDYEGSSESKDCEESSESMTMKGVQSPINKHNVTRQNIDIRAREEKDKKKPKPSEFELPEWVPKEAWGSFAEMRKKQGVFTNAGKKILVTKLKVIMEETGDTAEDIINQSIGYSWKGFFPIKRGNNGAQRFDKGNSKTGGVRKSTKYANLPALIDDQGGS